MAETWASSSRARPAPVQATWQFDPWAWSNGGSMEDPAGAGSVQALSFLTSLVKEGAAPKDVVNWSQAQPIQEFEAGKAAFCENGLWNIPGMYSSVPEAEMGCLRDPDARRRPDGHPALRW